MPQVVTVTGPKDASQLRLTLMHEHLFVNLLKEYRRDGLLNDVELCCDEVARFQRAGGGTIVDCTSEELGRNPLGLQQVSERTGVNIVMGCGHYRDPYLNRDWFDRTSVLEMADLMVAEITDGIGDTGVKPGIIGEIGADRWYVSAAEERSFRAAALTQRRTGLTITTHAARWPVGRRQLEILVQEGADPRRIIVGHCDSVPDTAYHEEIARRGSYVEFDAIRGTSEYDLKRVAGYVINLVRKGLGDRVLLSHDVCLTSHLNTYGGCGYDFIPTKFLPTLTRAGLTDEEVREFVVENPRRVLSGGS